MYIEKENGGIFTKKAQALSRTADFGVNLT